MEELKIDSKFGEIIVPMKSLSVQLNALTDNTLGSRQSKVLDKFRNCLLSVKTLLCSVPLRLEA